MAEEKEATTEGEEPKKKGKLFPILLGVILVVGAAVGTVAMMSPPPDEEPEEIKLEDLEAKRHDKQLDWSFNLRSAQGQAMGRLKISFDYKAEDPLVAAPLIEKGWDKAKSDVRKLLFGKKRSDFDASGALTQLSVELAKALESAFFPDGEGLVSEVFILDFIVQ